MSERSDRSYFCVRILVFLTGMAFFLGCAHSPSLVGKVVDERGNGVAGARVSLAGRSEAAITESDGRFRFGRLPPGTYALIVSAWSHYVPFRDSTRVQRGRLTEVELTVPEMRTGTIQGRVTSEVGADLPNAFVIVIGARVAGQTDRSGRFWVQDVPIGVHSLRAMLAGFEEVGRESIGVSEGDTTTVDFRLPPTPVKLMPDGTGTIQGMVVGDDGRGLQYANVIVVTARTGAQTDSKGHFRIIRVPIGTHTVRVRMVGFATEDRMGVHVGEGDTTTVYVKLREQEVKMVH